MRQLASIQKIAEVLPIENADSIEKIRVKDWWCVAKKGELKEGDYCVYFEIDSLLPVGNPAFEFLAGSTKPKNVIIDGKEHVGYGYRLKTIKLRGQISQGLALPLSSNVFGDRIYETVQEGDDVTEMLKIEKYEQPIPANLAGKIKGRRPNFIPKTDEERVQNFGETIDKLQGETFYITEKLDGSSSSFFKKDGELGVCSRNLELLDTPENTLWEIARKYHLANVLPDGYCIQGEIVGQGIQKNHLLLDKQDLFVFNVYNIDEHRYLNFDEFVDFCAQRNLQTVPVVNSSFILNTNVEGLLELADAPSVINENTKREGIVFRPLVEKEVENDGVMMRLSFKAISNQYLLKNE